jgi:hypothetical protein
MNKQVELQQAVTKLRNETSSRTVECDLACEALATAVLWSALSAYDLRLLVCTDS